MPDRLADWLALVDGMHPFRDAEAWDAVGLHVGDPDDEVTGVLVALDVTAAVLDEAVEVGADLLLAHHPLLFRPLDRLTPATAPGRLALLAARLGVAVAAAHTNLDVAAEGTSHPAARVLQLRDLAPLRTVTGPPRAKLVTFVPPEATEGVLEALSAAGAGVIGEYDACSFRLRGTGTFRPSAQANPHTGERGRINEVTEDRVEVVLPASAARRVVAALVAAHPYEEVAYDLYPLVDEPAAGKGLGLVGTLPTPLPLGQVAARLRSALPSPGLRVAGDLDRPVERVAVCGGSGGSLIRDALTAGADVLVTGDLGHHVALDALTQGLALVDAGHFATEDPALDGFVDRLRAAAPDAGLGAPITRSRVRTDPWADPSSLDHPADDWIHG